MFSFRSWLKKFTAPKPYITPTNRDKNRARLNLEQMEGRIVPASFDLIGAGVGTIYLSVMFSAAQLGAATGGRVTIQSPAANGNVTYYDNGTPEVTDDYVTATWTKKPFKFNVDLLGTQAYMATVHIGYLKGSPLDPVAPGPS